MAGAALLDIVAKSVFRQLNDPTLQEFLLLVWKNYKKDLQLLDQTIRTIADFLHDAEQKESTNDLVKGWLFRLKEVLYEADDLFDVIAYRAFHEKANAGNPFMNLCSKSIAHDVKAIRERLHGIKEDMGQFHFTLIKPIDVEENPISFREETRSFVKVEDLIGRDREIDEIVKLLLPEDESRGEDQSSLSVISIIGFEGLGKTTLAQLVYNDERVQSGFELCLWSCINHLSDVKQVEMAILSSVHKKKPEENYIGQLQHNLRESIGGRKYLLVLDDVWDEDASNWLKLKPLLSCGKYGSKVLVTTRSTKVAQCLDSIKPYYELSILSKESAWHLFVRMVFEEGELSSSSDPGLVLLGKQIVQKCGCLPLALVSIGRMLRYRRNEIKSWQYFVDKELPEGLVGDDGVDKVKLMQVLKVSYDDLPPALKLCFAYCSLFPKNHEFDKDELVRLWIAQGFIIPHGRKSLEEMGDDCFFHMVDRCFFQEVNLFSLDGYVRYTCKMHDLLHDLAIQVAGNECSCLAEKDLENMDEKTALRHISLNCNSNSLLDHSSMASQSKKLRTLLLFDEMNLEAKSLDSFFASFKVLRVLQLSDLDVKELPESVGELIHLRYLDLSKNGELIVLPNSICKLHHLQTLILEGCRKLKELPSDLGKLVNLRNLILEGCRALDTFPSGLATLTALVTLDRIKVHHHSGGLGYMGHLDNLCGMVSIELPRKGWPNCMKDAREASMFRKRKLNGLIMDWEADVYIESEMEEEEEGVENKLLEQLKPSENLQYLKIAGYGGDTLSNWFSSLSNLKELVLYRCSSLEYLEDVGCVRSGGSSLFPCLEILTMNRLWNLKGWWREYLGDNVPMSVVPCLPRVLEVNIECCPNLMESMPLFGKGIKNLRLNTVNGKLVSMLLSTTPNMKCHHYTKLHVLRLEYITDLKCLPKGWIRHLTALKSLSILGCYELSSVSSCGLSYLTSLEELQIFHNGNVRLLIEDEGDEKCVPWKTLQRLRRLEVPWQSHLQEGLQYLTSLEELNFWYYEADQVEADNEDMNGRGLLSKLGLLKRLHSLDIYFGEIRCNFPKWIQYLCCLKELRLEDCEELMDMSWGIILNMNLLSLMFSRIRKLCSVDDWVREQQIQCNSLVQLCIYGNLDKDEQQWIHDDVPWKLLPSLRILTFAYIRNMRGTPGGIQHLTSLQQLTFGDCYGMEGNSELDDQSPPPLPPIALYYNVTSSSERRTRNWCGY